MVKEMKEGLGVIMGKRGVRSLVVIMGVICFFIGFVQTLSGPMLLAVCDEKTVGILESVCAVGMLVGSLWIGIVGIRKNYAAILCAAGIAGGLCMASAGVTRNLFVTGTGIFLFFLSLPFLNTCADVLVRVSIPNELQGRAWGMISLLTQSGTVLAYVLCGVLADWVFEPMLAEGGLLSASIGRVIGTGEGRGIGLMLILSGMGMALAVMLAGRNKSVRSIKVS